MKVALYARVSKPPKGALSDQQRRDQNPEVQLRELREWCERSRHTIVVEYVDRLSGKNAKRPQLQKLMRDVEKGLQDVDAVVVWRLDRFGRSVLDLEDLVAQLRGAGVSFVSLKEGFDLGTATGKAMFGMLAVFAEFERNVIAERTRAGMALARAEGRLPGRKIDPRKGPSRSTIWRQRKREQVA
jgi:DNA invertase Pin-like site-specific DNA recombinase